MVLINLVVVVDNLNHICYSNNVINLIATTTNELIKKGVRLRLGTPY